MMCDGRLFGPQIAAIGLNRAVHLAPISGHETVEALAAEVLANAPPRFALAGLSMGGIVAMEVIRQAPERVEQSLRKSLESSGSIFAPTSATMACKLAFALSPPCCEARGACGGLSPETDFRPNPIASESRKVALLPETRSCPNALMGKVRRGGGWPAIVYTLRKAREAGGIWKLYREKKKKNGHPA